MSERLSPADIYRENRKLRRVVEALLDEIEDEDSLGIDCDCLRSELPEHPAEKHDRRPKWEREGYETKEAWMEAREE